MYRVFWFLAGAVISYIGSGYLEGLLGDDRQTVKEERS